MTRRTPGVLAVVLVLAGLPTAAGAGVRAKPEPDVTVMTRNVFLGASLDPGLKATNLQELVTGAGVILKQVDDNNFPTRARGLAAEIRGANPDLVGLQEVALWRTEPCTESPIPPHAADVRYDFLKLLLARLNAGRNRYRPAVVQPEFDFEVWVNTDGNESTAAPGCPFGSEINGRLTMRDVILARNGRVTTSNPKGGPFKTLLQVKPGGVNIDVVRGWTRVDAKVPGVPKFRFVNVHLEAFDNQATNHTNTGSDVGNGQIRETQARELFAPGGPATGRLPVVLLGDLNSDIRTEVKPGDALAYRALRNAGFAERAASRPFSCCLKGDLLTVSGGGKRADFNHQVDHVMTNRPRQFKLLRSSVTGLSPVNGYWNSDHRGIVTEFVIP